MSQKFVITTLLLVLATCMFLHVVTIRKNYPAGLLNEGVPTINNVIWKDAFRGKDAVSIDLPERLILSEWWNVMIWPILAMLSIGYIKLHYRLIQDSDPSGLSCMSLVAATIFYLLLSALMVWGYFELSGVKAGLIFSCLPAFCLMAPICLSFKHLYGYGLAGSCAPMFSYVAVVSTIAGLCFGFVVFVALMLLSLPAVILVAGLISLLSWWIERMDHMSVMRDSGN